MPAQFDHIAKKYDADFTFSEIGKKQRQLVYRYLKKLPTNQNILELNCGTGEDALWFKEKGHTILATDISKNMIDIAKKKASYKKDITFLLLDIKTLSKETFPEKFDVIFSNFGGFNCLNNLEMKSFFKAVNSTLTDNGKIILVIMPKNCLWENLYFFSKGMFKKAFRRHTKLPINVKVGLKKMATWYYNPQNIKHLCAPYFKITHIKPIGFFIPPSYLESYFKRHKLILSILDTLEKSIAKFRFLSRFSDHYLIEIEKNNQ